MRGEQQLESTLAAQDGMRWFANDELMVGLAPGAMSVNDAQHAVDEVLDESLSPNDATFAKPLVVRRGQVERYSTLTEP